MRQQKWWELLTYDDVTEMLGYAKITMQNIGYFRDTLPKFVAAMSQHWYPYAIGTSSGNIQTGQDNSVNMPFEMHHIELTNGTGQDMWINFNSSAYVGLGVKVPNGSTYIAEVAFTELHYNPAASTVSYNNPNNANNFALIVGRRIGLR